jgi:predicted aldo/keto reductase-like oxidoreductase
MIYSTLGRTGLRVSRLGFGAMRLPMKDGNVVRDKAIPMIHYAFEHGVTYIDTAVGYCNSDSQRVVGEALKGWRDKVVLSTKNHCYEADEKAWWTHLENSLERLDVGRIDIYNTHGVNEKTYDEAVVPHIRGWLEKALDQGLIGHICTSFHGTKEFLRRLVDDGLYESLTIQYNLLNREFEDEIAYAKSKGMGVVCMGPVGGGRLGGHSEVLEHIVPEISRIPELALRFVLANPNVDVALSGMSTMDHVKENVAIVAADRTLDGAERKLIDDHAARVKEMSKLYCTGCRYCMPCEQCVDIPKVFSLYNLGRVYGLWDHARAEYARLIEGQNDEQRVADACVECGLCSPKCPQHIDIPKELKDAHEALTAK